MYNSPLPPPLLRMPISKISVKTEHAKIYRYMLLQKKLGNPWFLYFKTDPEDGVSRFLRNVDNTNYSAL
jgi:hypothetical protein